MFKYLVKLFWYIIHYNMFHFRRDLGDIFKYEDLPTGGQVGFRKCIKCGRVFVDFDGFSFSRDPVKQ
jgi:hypothetical protein